MKKLENAVRKAVLATMFVFSVMLFACPVANAEIGFGVNGVTEKTQVSNVDSKNAVIEEVIVIDETGEDEEVQIEAKYDCLIARSVKAKDVDKLDIWNVSEKNSLATYFTKVQAKHGQEFLLVASSREVFEEKLQEIAELKLKATQITSAGKIPENVESTFVEQIGTDKIWVAKVEFKEPGHKSWLEQNWLKVLGGVASVGLF